MRFALNPSTIKGLLVLLISTPLLAGLTPGQYTIETLGGKKVGSCTVEMTKEKKDRRYEIDTTLDTAGGQHIESETIIVDKKGLKYFKRLTTNEGNRTSLEGVRYPNEIRIRQEINGERTSWGANLKEFDITEYELDMKHSPFRKMKKVGQSKALSVFSVDKLKAVKTVRNVNTTEMIEVGKKEIEALVVNTNIGGSIVVSYFHPKTGALLRERRGDLVFRRVE